MSTPTWARRTSRLSMRTKIWIHRSKNKVSLIRLSWWKGFSRRSFAPSASGSSTSSTPCSARSTTTGATWTSASAPWRSTQSWVISKFLFRFTHKTKRPSSAWFTTRLMNLKTWQKENQKLSSMGPSFSFSKMCSASTPTRGTWSSSSSWSQCSIFGNSTSWGVQSTSNGRRTSSHTLCLNVTNCTSTWTRSANPLASTWSLAELASGCTHNHIL